jgi:hypothetical protein
MHNKLCRSGRRGLIPAIHRTSAILRKLFKPGLECLEDRTLPAGAISPTVWFSPAIDSAVPALFQRPQDWTSAREKVNVLLLEQPELVNNSGRVTPNTWSTLQAAGLVQSLAKWNMQLAFDASVIIPQWLATPDHAERDSRAAIAHVKSAGGHVSYLAMDEPFYQGTVPCGMSPTATLDRIASFMQHINSYDPSVAIGLDEPYPALSVQTIEAEVNGLSVRGRAPAFFHLDINFDYLAVHPESAAKLGEDLRTLESYFAQKGIPLGIIFWGGGPAASYQQNATQTLEYLSMVKSAMGVPHDAIFQTWGQQKSLPNGPDTQLYTHTWLLNQGLQELLGAASAAVSSLSGSGSTVGSLPGGNNASTNSSAHAGAGALPTSAPQHAAVSGGSSGSTASSIAQITTMQLNAATLSLNSSSPGDSVSASLATGNSTVSANSMVVEIGQIAASGGLDSAGQAQLPGPVFGLIAGDGVVSIIEIDSSASRAHPTYTILSIPSTVSVEVPLIVFTIDPAAPVSAPVLYAGAMPVADGKGTWIAQPTIAPPTNSTPLAVSDLRIPVSAVDTFFASSRSKTLDALAELTLASQILLGDAAALFPY